MGCNVGQVWKDLHACKTMQTNIKGCCRGCHIYSFLHKALAKTFWTELDKIHHHFFTNFVSDKTPKDLRKLTTLDNNLIKNSDLVFKSFI